MGCIVCVTTSAGAEGEESPLLSKSLSSSNSGIASRDKSLKKNRPGLGDKPQAVTSFRVRGALQSLLPKRSQAHSVPNIDEYAGEDDGWQKEAKDITETRELHLERDHLGNTCATTTLARCAVNPVPSQCGAPEPLTCGANIRSSYVNQYIIVRNLGRGSFGKARRAEPGTTCLTLAQSACDWKRRRAGGVPS